jgi:hypothetical protein
MSAILPDPHEPDRLPRLVRLYLRQIGLGFLLSGVFVGLLLGFDVAHLRSLMLATRGGWLAAFLLFFFNGLVFAGVQFAISIMRMADPEDKGPRGGHGARVAPRRMAPVRIDLR